MMLNERRHLAGIKEGRLLAALMFLLTVLPLMADESLTPGKIIDPVICKSDPKRSYALYLPSNYTPQQHWPILYCYDAREHGALPAELFRETAEKYGYIVASSNNTRSDDATWPNLEAMRSLWDDTHARFPINDKRVYATGFSGGARLAWGLGYLFPKSVAGVIGCSGGAHPDRPPAKDTPFIYYGTAGNLDFNYAEMVALDQKFEELGIPHGLTIFPGTHSWPPKEVAAKALEWMELQAMKAGLKEKNAEIINAFFEKRTSEASALEGFQKLRAFEAIVRDFSGLKDITQQQQQITLLKDSDEVKKYKKDQEKRDREAQEYRQKLGTAIALLHQPGIPPSAGDLSQQLEVATLKKKAAKDPNSEDALAAQRMLESAFVQMNFYLPNDFLTKKDYIRAITALTVATTIHEDRPNGWYNLGCAYARSGDKKKAIESLRRSVQAGFADRHLMETDEDLTSIRGEQAYKQILASLPSAH